MSVLERWLREDGLTRSTYYLPEARPRPRTCLCCGQCCESFGGHLQASRADLLRWRRLGREDILRRVSSIGWLWIDPETGKLEERCPFLERTSETRATCAIHDVKPQICRDYPTLAHGSRCLRGVFLGVNAIVWLEELVEPAVAIFS